MTGGTFALSVQEPDVPDQAAMAILTLGDRSAHGRYTAIRLKHSRTAPLIWCRQNGTMNVQNNRM